MLLPILKDLILKKLEKVDLLKFLLEITGLIKTKVVMCTLNFHVHST